MLRVSSEQHTLNETGKRVRLLIDEWAEVFDKLDLLVTNTDADAASANAAQLLAKKRMPSPPTSPSPGRGGGQRNNSVLAGDTVTSAKQRNRSATPGRDNAPDLETGVRVRDESPGAASGTKSVPLTPLKLPPRAGGAPRRLASMPTGLALGREGGE